MNASIRRYPFLTFMGLCLAVHSAAAQQHAGRPASAVAKELTSVLEVLSTSYVSPVSTDELAEMALRALLRELDASGGAYFNKDDFDALRQGKAGNDRIGINVMNRQGSLILVPVPGGPARQAGLRVRDRLISVDGKSVLGLSVHQASRLLDGAAGSSVRLTVARDGAEGPLDFQVTRAEVPTRPEPSASRPAPTVAMLRVTQFTEKTLETSAELLQKEWKVGEFSGLILDLRGNPGGLLTTAIGLPSMFLNPGDVVGTTRGRLPDANFVYTAEPLASYAKYGSGRALASLPPALRAVRLVVLVDEATSSGAEFAVAALQDHRRATVIGRPTLGRGSIQTILALSPEAAVKVTTAYWFAPSDRPLEDRGVTPDRIVAEADETGIVQAAVQLLTEQR